MRKLERKLKRETEKSKLGNRGVVDQGALSRKAKYWCVLWKVIPRASLVAERRRQGVGN